MTIAVRYTRSERPTEKSGIAPPRLDWVKRTGTIAMDSSYPTGGEVLDVTILDLAAVHFLKAMPSSGFVFEYDYANSKLMAFYADNNNAADGPLIEVPNLTSLAALTAVRFMAIGRIAQY